MSATALSLRGVSKSYRAWPAGDRTLRGIVARRSPFLSRGGARRWALRDVSLDLEPGESVGVIGPNGAGKSTLLRLAAGIGRPDAGAISTPRRTAAVLGFDSWFDLQLTGRENALTALVLNGWSRAESRDLLPAVFDFAELEDAIDAPVRTYSEGMKLRLAFGVVAQLQPEALLVDEVISVGDARFQEKCIERISRMRDRGTTLLLSSHALEQLERQCDRVLWLQAGRVRALGPADSVIGEYRDAMRSETLDRTPAPTPDVTPGGLVMRENRFGSQELTIDSVTLLPGAEIATGWPLELRIELRGHGRTIVGAAIHRADDGVLCHETSTEASGLRVHVDGSATVSLVLDRLDLMPGEYRLDVGAYEPSWSYAYDFHWQAYPLRVTGPAGEKGVFRPPHRWEVRSA